MSVEKDTNSGGMTVREAGQRGGKRLAEKMKGTDFFRDIGQKGGSKTKEKYGEDYYARIGQMGGSKTSETHGPDFYQQIGRKGGGRVRSLIARAKALEAAENGEE